MPEPDRVVMPKPAESLWRDLGNPSTEPLGPNPLGNGLTTLTGRSGRRSPLSDTPGTSGVVSREVPPGDRDAGAASETLRVSGGQRERKRKDATLLFQQKVNSKRRCFTVDNNVS